MHLLIAFLLLQNITISGTLQDAVGKPLTGVRVGAMPVAETLPLKHILGVLGTTYTDKDGRYTLEIPPGAYYIVAGTSRPTYYTATGSKVVIRTSRVGVNFVVNAANLPPVPGRVELRRQPIQWDVPPTPPKLPRPRWE